MAIKIFHVDRDFVEVPLVQGALSAKIVVWPGVGARLASFHHVAYEAGQSSVAHAHPAAEDVFYIVRVEGSMVEYRNGREVGEQPIGPGSVVLPAPFSPRRAWISPGNTSKSTSRFATVAP